MYIGYIFIIVNKKHMLSIYPAHIIYNIFYLLSTLISKIKKNCICAAYAQTQRSSQLIVVRKLVCKFGLSDHAEL